MFDHFVQGVDLQIEVQSHDQIPCLLGQTGHTSTTSTLALGLVRPGELGHEPLLLETPEGKAHGAPEHRGFTAHGQALRPRLPDAIAIIDARIVAL